MKNLPPKKMVLLMFIGVWITLSSFGQKASPHDHLEPTDKRHHNYLYERLQDQYQDSLKLQKMVRYFAINGWTGMYNYLALDKFPAQERYLLSTYYRTKDLGTVPVRKEVSAEFALTMDSLVRIAVQKARWAGFNHDIFEPLNPDGERITIGGSDYYFNYYTFYNREHQHEESYLEHVCRTSIYDPVKGSRMYRLIMLMYTINKTVPYGKLSDTDPALCDSMRTIMREINREKVAEFDEFEDKQWNFLLHLMKEFGNNWKRF